MEKEYFFTDEVGQLINCIEEKAEIIHTREAVEDNKTLWCGYKKLVNGEWEYTFSRKY